MRAGHSTGGTAEDILFWQERKRALEAERQARVEELLIRRKEQEARIELQRQERERAREDAARERARSVALTGSQAAPSH